MKKNSPEALEMALESLLARVERGQEYEAAERSVVSMHPVNLQQLREAYDDFCCIKPHTK